MAEDLLGHYASKSLIDPYDTYQHLMDFWVETMQDDCYLISADGWKAETYRVMRTGQEGRGRRRQGWACGTVPKALIVASYHANEQAAIDQLAGNWKASLLKSPNWKRNTEMKKKLLKNSTR